MELQVNSLVFIKHFFTYKSQSLNIFNTEHLFKSRAQDKREYLEIIRDNFLLILHKNICCDPSFELSRRDNSDEGSRHKVSMRNKKNIIKYYLI